MCRLVEDQFYNYSLVDDILKVALFYRFQRGGSLYILSRLEH